MRTVLIDISGNNHQVAFEHTPLELAAIGEISVQWSFLEHVIYRHSALITETVGTALPSDVENPSFKRRLTAWRQLIERHAPDDEKKRLLKIISKIANAQDDRHKVSHGLWSFDYSNPGKLTASGERPPFEFTKSFDTQQLADVAKRIGAITFQLLYPNGPDDFYAEKLSGNSPFVGISRRLLLETKDASNQSHPAKPQSGKPPQSPSQA